MLAYGFGAPMAWLYLTPLRLLVAGPAAVLVFFVLSGLVLARSFVERDRVEYLPFAIKRVFRIWLPFAGTILVAAALTHVVSLGPVAGTSWWFATSWQHPASMASVSRHLLMTGTATDLDSPMWSLMHEMRVSLIFPILVALTLWNWPVALLGSVACSVVCVEAGAHGWMGRAAWPIVSTGTYVFLFVAGTAMARGLPAIRRGVAGLPVAAITGLWVVAAGGLCVCPVQTAIVLGLRADVALVSCGFAAALVVLLCAVEGRAFRALLGPIPLYLGRISHSLYLLHVIVLVAVVRELRGWLPVPLLVVLGIAVSIGLADLCQRWVEVPSTALERRLSRKVGRSVQPT